MKDYFFFSLQNWSKAPCEQVLQAETRFLSLLLFIFLFFKKNNGGIQHRDLQAGAGRGPLGCRPVLQGLMESCPALLVSPGESEKCNTGGSQAALKPVVSDCCQTPHQSHPFPAQQREHFGFFPSVAGHESKQRQASKSRAWKTWESC